ncbi:MAG: hypothetical protein ACI7YS_13370, partial [Flavobacterium sp.]
MRITTLYKFYFFIFLTVIGYNSSGYSQCPTVNPNQSFCDTQNPKVGNLQATDNGGGVKWYGTATATTPLLSTESLTNNKVYYVDDNTGACGTRSSVLVKVYTKPSGPGSVTFCQASTVADLMPYVSVNNGGLIKWYDASPGGDFLEPTTQLINNTYYASQANPDGSCESTRKAITVNITIVPVPTGNPVQEFCQTSFPTVDDLAANGTNILWYESETDGNSLAPSQALEDGHSYFAESSTNDGTCSSATRLEVLVYVNELNDAGTNGSKEICVDQVSSAAPFDLFGLLGGTPDNTGVWTGQISTVNGYIGTLLDVSTMTLAESPYVFTYTVTSATCPPVSSTVTITINPNITPTFTQVPAICSGATLLPLPTVSNNGITGAWSPALDNTATKEYTFTPDAGQCATIAKMTITVNTNIVPTFTQVPAICSGATLLPLPTASNNGITGTWLPALDNTATKEYTFTPDAGQCATIAKMTITVNTDITPTFTQVPAICSGATLLPLPTVSNNGITGAWSPALDNTVTKEYTFTPDAGQCATIAKMTITVNTDITPTFTQVP